MIGRFCKRWLGFIVAAQLAAMALHAEAWTVRLDFNSGNEGSKVGGMGAQGRTVYSRDNVYEGPQSAKLTVLKGETGYGNWGGYIPHPESLGSGDELWFRVRSYFPTGFNYFADGYRLKFLRMQTTSAKGANEGYNDIHFNKKGSSAPFMFIFEGENRWVGMGKEKHWPVHGAWETYEFYVKFHHKARDEGGQAVIRFWKNGELLGEITDRKTLRTPTSRVPRSLLFTYWNGGASRTQSMWVDDIVLTSDMPSSTDAHGNLFIGMGSENSVSPPAPPSLKVSGE